jgi:hypothetical protein
MPSKRTSRAKPAPIQQPPAEAEALFENEPAVDTVAAGAPIETAGQAQEASEEPVIFDVAPVEAASGETTEPPVVDEPVETSDAPIPVRLGQARGLLHRMPVDVVLSLLPDFAEGIATLSQSGAVRGLQERMLATEGQCAPVYFTMKHGDSQPRLMDGVQTMAAAVAAGLEKVSVVIVPHSLSEEAHRFICEQAQPAPSADDEDEELQVLVNAFYEAASLA